MLGFYQNFPQNVHQKMAFTHSALTKKLQQKLMEALFEFNNATFDFDQITCPTVPKCIINFEIGIAEENNFNFIDEEELHETVAFTNKTVLQMLDFFWAIRYHLNAEEKTKPLKFDYYLLRFSFFEKLMEIEVVHERGPRYISPEDLVDFLVKKLNRVYQKKNLKPVQNQ
jgi:hypothetical protein